jgi:hypothetical protein
MDVANGYCFDLIIKEYMCTMNLFSIKILLIPEYRHLKLRLGGDILDDDW